MPLPASELQARHTTNQTKQAKCHASGPFLRHSVLNYTSSWRHLAPQTGAHTQVLSYQKPRNIKCARVCMWLSYRHRVSLAKSAATGSKYAQTYTMRIIRLPVAIRDTRALQCVLNAHAR